ncbi:uncharacterized protein [Coffea arabica]|uniref:CCHC-type domain-containing protein n=1 Tax=Coffea arabica TaxID=13443 RepID=A0A6P6SBJ6_COFAR|nr:uncharacterized protein LOC113689265 [Coffea arabica]
MAKKLVCVIRDHPNMTSKGVKVELRKYGVKPSKMQVFRDKNKALAEIEGTNGFMEGCRPFLGFNGCFLKGPFGSVLLTAVAFDANNNIFPIAFAGLNLAYEEIFTDATGSHCCRHICSNFKVQFPDIIAVSFGRQLKVMIYLEFHANIQHQELCTGQKLESYCETWFTKNMYLKAYSAMIHPILHVKRWPPILEVLPKTALPPPLRRAPGRPRVNRMREANEGASSSQAKRSSTLKCGNCGAFGHNKRTCK